MIPLEGINALRAFLLRAPLKGDEVDAFNRCVGFLHNEERLTRLAMQAEADKQSNPAVAEGQLPG